MKSNNTDRKPRANEKLHFEALEPRILFDASAPSAPTADVSIETKELTTNEDQLVNDDISFSITFDNSGGSVGYLPYLDIVASPEMEITDISAFGSALSNPDGAGTDAIGMISAGGELVDISTGLPIDHPLYSSSIGAPASDYFGGAGSGSEPVTFDPALAGSYVYSVALPFGSYTPGNPPIDVNVTASLDTADGILPSTDYSVVARGGYALGCDADDNPGTIATPDDEPVFGSSAMAQTHPLLLSLTKTANDREDDGAYTGESVSGPNHPLTFEMKLDIATGELVTGLTLTDVLPDDLAYLGNLSVTDGAGGMIAFTINSQPAVNTDDITGVSSGSNTISLNLGDITGIDGTDVIVTYEAFVPYVEQGGDLVVNETTGEEGDLNEYNDASISGNWGGDVVGDNAGPITGGDPDGVLGEIETDYQIEEHSIAIQKGVDFATGGDRGASGWSEGDVAEYTSNFQISDYFAFDNVLIVDVLGDGLEFLPALDPMSTWANAGDFPTSIEETLSLRPSLTFTMNGGVNNDPMGPMNTITVDFDEANFSAIENATDGTTTVEFDVYQQLVDSGFITAGGALTGGMIPAIGIDPADMGTFNSGIATVGTLTYRARVRDEFASTPGSPEVSQGDTLVNDITITGRILDVETLTPGVNVSDGSEASIGIPTGTLTKELFSATRNGIQILVADLEGNLEVVPGDVVTWRLNYELPISEFETFSISDFLPLPIFDASSIDLSQVYGYELPGPDGMGGTTDGYLTAGRISFGSNNTFHGSSGPGVSGGGGIDETPGYAAPETPVITIDSLNNAVSVNFGEYAILEGEAPVSTTVEIFVSIVVQEGVYADGLLFTNQASASENSSFTIATATNSIANVLLVVPDVNITKGVLSTDSGGTFSGSQGPMGVTFTAPGSMTAFSGTITSEDIATDPIDANVSGLDAGDLVTFGILVENTGESLYGAFDLEITDTLPSGFAMPATMAELNLRVTDGAGNLIDYNIIGGGTTPVDFFANGIELVDPGVNQGALTEYNGTSGANILLIAYDVAVDSSAILNEAVTNTATVTNFSYFDGGENQANAGDTDTAVVSVARPTVSKAVINTSHDDVDNLDAEGEVSVGEVVTYEVTIEIPEGTMPLARVFDTLPSGMAFIGLDTISFSSGLSTDRGNTDFTDVRAYYNAGASTLELGIDGVGAGLGNLVNSNTDNSTMETITFRYRAVVLNAGVNQAGLVQTNDATIQWQESGMSQTEEDSESVLVVEPNLSVSKVVLGGDTSVEGSDTVTYRITIANYNSIPDGMGGVILLPNVSEAYEVSLSDILPDDVAFVSAVYSSGVMPDGVTMVGDSVTYNGGVGTEGEVAAAYARIGAGESSTIDVTVSIDPALPTDTVIVNTAEIDFSSIQGDPGDMGYQGFDSNTSLGPNIDTADTIYDIAGERTGDVMDPGGSANDYRDANSASVIVENPVGIDKLVIDTSEDHTSFDASIDGPVRATIGEVVRYEVRIRIPQATNGQVQLVDTLGDELFWIDESTNDIQFRLEGFAAGGGTIAADADIEAAIAGSASLDPSRVNFTSGTNTVTFDFGDIVNTETDTAAEYIYISYNTIVKNDSSVAGGDVATNTVQVREGGVDVGPSLEQTLTVVEPSVSISKSDNGVSTADAGDIIDYTLTVTAAGGVNNTTAFDLSILDALPDELDLVGGSLLVTGLPVGSTLLTSSEDIVTDTISVTVDLLEVGETFQITFQAEVRDMGADIIRADELVDNTANLSYSTLPGDGTDDGVDGNTTGNESGTPEDEDGERVTSASNSAAFTSAVPVLSKVLADPSDQTFTIGELVEYVITLDVPEGALGNPEAYILDQIDPGFNFVAGSLSVVTDAGVVVGTTGMLNEGNAGFFTHTNPADTTLSETLRLEFGEISYNEGTANDGVNVNGTIEVRYMLRVENILANQQGGQRNNVAEFIYTDETGTATNTVADSTGSMNTIITIVEPQVDAVKTITSIPANPDALDTVVYEVTLTHPGSAMNPNQNVTAFEVIAQDVLPTNLDLQTGTFTAMQGMTDVSAQFTVTADGWVTAPMADLDLAPGDVITITYSATILVPVRDGDTLTNVVDVEWTSIDGTNADERGGDGDLDTDSTNQNDYEDTATADVDVNLTPTFNFTKTIRSTSDATTGTGAGASATVTDLVVGETVTYELTATLGRGITDGVRIEDVLSIAEGVLDITSVTFETGAAISLTNGMPFTSITPTVTNMLGADTYNDTVVVDFGSITNDPNLSTGIASEQITVVITAIVRNDVLNQQGDVITNTGSFIFQDDHDGDGIRTEQTINDTEDVEIIEPQVDAAKSITSIPTNPDAGDTVVYEVTLTHPGSAMNPNQNVTAFEVIAQDVLPTNLDLQTGTFTAMQGMTDVSALFTVTADGWATVPMADIDLAPGEVITITYSATILTPVRDGDTLTNAVDVEWTSIDGTNAGERGGDGDLDTDSTDQNDYEDTATADVDVNLTPKFDFTKAIRSTSESNTGVAAGGSATVTDLVVGETVTYELTATFGQGIIDGVRIEDVLSIAEGVLDITSVTFETGAAISLTNGMPFTSITPTVTNALGADTYNDTVVVDFGSITNDPNLSTGIASEQITVVITAIVRNDVLNQQGDVISNTGDFFYQDDHDGDGIRTEQNIEDSVDVELVEPQVDAAKSVTSVPTNPDAGDTVAYEVTLTHPGSAMNPNQNVTAFEVIAQDVLPTNLDLQTGTFTAMQGMTDVSALFTVTADGWATVPMADIDLAPGEVITITYSATILTPVRDGDTLTNAVDVEWTSIDGTNAGERGGDGDLDTDSTDQNDYEDTATADVDVNLTPKFDFTKAIRSTSDATTGTGAGASATVTDLVVGETVTYELTATFGQGIIDGVRIEDVLSIAEGVLDITSVTFETGAALSLTNGMPFTSITPTVTNMLGADTYNDTVVVDFGSITNDPNLSTGIASEQITVVITAIVRNDVLNQQGDVISNTGDFFYQDDHDGDGIRTEQNIEDSVDVELVEPQVDAAKSVTSVPTNPDAGDTVAYEVTLTHPGSAMNPNQNVTAFEVIAQDVLPTNLDLQTGTFTAMQGMTDVSALFTVTADGWATVPMADIDLAPGEVITITYSATILTPVRDGDTLTNAVDVEWTSIDGTNAGERGGDGDLDTDSTDQNDYEDTATADVDVNLTPKFDFTKAIRSTSESNTGVAAGGSATVTDLVVGETVTYELTATFGQGIIDGVRIEDVLSIAEGVLDITSVTFETGAAISLTNGMPFTSITPTVTNALGADTYNDTVVVDFGSITNDPNLSTGIASEQITVVITAIVRNDVLNQQGDVISNTGDFFYQDDHDGDGIRTEQNIEDSVDVELVEPQVDAAKSVTSVPANPDAGDTVAYEVTLTHPGSAMNPNQNVTAFEVIAQDVLPSNLDLQTGTFTAMQGMTDVSASFTVTADGWVTAPMADIDLAPGEVITITYSATILTPVRDGDTLTNAVDVEWTSIDGTNAGERGGDGDLTTDSTDQNDYEDTATADVDVNLTPKFDFTKAIRSTSESNTGVAAGGSATVTDLVVGETVTYELTATLGRGITDGVRIEDVLSIAEGVLDITSVTFETGAAISLTNGMPFTSITPTVTNMLGTDTYNDTVVVDFGSITNDPSLSTGIASEQITVVITAIVRNDVPNQQGDVISNTGDFFYQDDHDGDGIRTEQNIEDSVDVELVEPQVDAAKSVTSVPANPDAGDTVAYEVTLTHPGSAMNPNQNVTAFEVIAQDVLPTNLDLQTGTFTAMQGMTDVSASFTVTADGWVTAPMADIDLAPGDVITITYSATILTPVRDGDTLTNVVDVEWTSIDGTNAGERGGDGDLDTDSTDQNDYEDTATADVDVNLTPAFDFTKTIRSTSESNTGVSSGDSATVTDLVVGETVTYALTATIGRGTTDGIRIEDVLSITNGLFDITDVQIEAGAALSLTNGMPFTSITPTVTNALGADTYNDTVVVDFGSITNDPSLSTGVVSEQITVLITAIVKNDLANQQGDVISNTGDFFYQDDHDGDGIRTEQNIEDSVDVELVEPHVDAVKTITAEPAMPDAGDTVSYQVVVTHPGGPGNLQQNVTAYDIAIRDALPTNLTLQTGSFQAELNGTTDVSGLFTLSASGWSDATAASINLNPGDVIVITYDALIGAGVRDGDTLTNQVDIEWTSTDGVDPEERGGDGDLDTQTPGGNPNDYEDRDTTSFDAEFTNAFEFEKTVFSTSQAATDSTGGTNPLTTDLVVGETVTYALTAKLGRGVTDGVRIVDQLSIANGILDITQVTFDPGDALSLTSGAAFSTIMPSITDALGMDGYHDRVVVDFGSITNDPSMIVNPEDEYVVVYVTAVVVNIGENQEGDVISNEGEFFYQDDPDGDGVRTEQTINDTEDVEIIEPQVDAAKSVTSVPVNPDAGDTVAYEVTLTHPGSAMNPNQNVTAFEVIAQDVLPSNLDLQTGTFTAMQGMTDVSAQFTVTADGWVTAPMADLDLAPGDVITITYSATILTPVRDGDTLTNVVDVEWTSIDGTNAGERGGDGDLTTDSTDQNDYEDTATADVDVNFTPAANFTKTIRSTSESNTGIAAGGSATVTDLVVGETVTYALTATIGRGTTDGIRIEDVLSITNGLFDITDVQIEAGAALSLTNGMPFTSITPTVTNMLGTDTYNDTVVVDFGSITNDPSLSTGVVSEQITVLVTAIVTNDLANQQGDVISNTGDFFYQDDHDGDGIRTEQNIEDSVDVELVEPQVDAAKSVTSVPVNPDAGDTVAYEVTLTHPGSAMNPNQNVTAFEVIAQDVLPANLDLQTGTFTAMQGMTDVSASFTVTADGWVTAPMADIDLAPGDVITITYSATILTPVRDGDTLTNVVDVEWTSIDGTNAGERGGDGDLDTDSTDQNDYEDTATADVDVNLTPAFDFTKTIRSTSESNTGVSSGDSATVTDLVVGETVTYALTATIGRGTTDGIRIEDVLSITNGLFDITDVQIEAGAALSLTNGMPFTSITPTVTNALGADTYNDTVVVDFGSITNDPSLSTGVVSEQITVLITAIVKNDLANQQGDVISNTGDFFYQDDHDGDGIRTEQNIEDSVDVELVEPHVDAVKTITAEPAMPDAGDTVSYQVVVTHPGGPGNLQQNVTAYDIAIRDALPTNLTLQTGSFQAELNGTTDVSGLFTLSASGWSDATAASINLNPGDVIVITYDALIGAGVRDGDTLTNQVDIEWTSTDGVDPEERGGDGDLDTQTPGGNPNDYEDRDTTSFDAEFTNAFEFEKTVFSTSQAATDSTGGTNPLTTDLVVGETVTYALTAKLGRGVTDGVRIVDQLSIANGILDITQVTFDPGDALSLTSGAAFSTIMPSITDALGMDGYHDRVVVDFGSITNDPSMIVNPEDEYVVVYVTAVVVNIGENQEGDVISNEGEFFYQDDPDGDGVRTEQTINDTKEVELLEPSLRIAKTVDNEQPRLNETITYTLTVFNDAGVSTTDAFDLVIDDVMDPRMTLDPASVQLVVLGAPMNPSVIVTNTSTSNNLILGIDRLEEGESIQITYEVRVSDDPADFDAVLLNDVGLDYTSTEGMNPDERGGNPTGPGDPNDYTDDASESVEVFQPDLVIQKVDNDAVIDSDGLIEYVMTVTNEGRASAIGVNITDDISEYLGAGFEFVSGTNAVISGGVVTFTLPDMPIGDVQVVNLILRAPSVFPAGLESITNSATANHDDIDPTEENNTDTEPTPVMATPDLVVSKDDGLVMALTGDEITYTITFSNVGNQIASGVELVDTLPDGVRFVSATGDGTLRANNEVFWSLDELAPGREYFVEVVVEVIEPGLQINRVTIQDDEKGGEDPTPENNRDEDETITEYRFRYDLNQDFRRQSGNRPQGLNLHDRIVDGHEDAFVRNAPVILATHMNSGLAQPGATISLTVFDEAGNRIGETSVMADAGGNWMATFPNAKIDRQPARIEMKQTWASYDPVGERSYNFRTYFGPAFTSGTYYTEHLSVTNVTEKRAATEVIDLYESSKMILALDWNSSSYEIAARGALQSSSSN